MSPVHVSFVGLCVAEWRKIRGRGLAYAVLLLGLLHGLLGPAFVKAAILLGHQLGAGDIDPVDWLVGADVGLYFAIFPINGFALLLLAAMMWAEDFSLGTMSMIFVRSVPRWKVFASKVVVAWLMGIASLALALFAGAALGLLLLGWSGDISALANYPLLQWMAPIGAAATDVAAGDVAVAPAVIAVEPLGLFARLGGLVLRLAACTLILGPPLAVAAFWANLTRSPIMTLFGSVFVLVLDGFVWAGGWMWGTSNLTGNTLAGALSDCTIWGSRRSFYTAVSEGPIVWDWMGICITVAYTVVVGALALWMFVKRDVT